MSNPLDYIKVKWIHTDVDTPVWLYSELDSERNETRKVYVYADGRCGYADKSEEVGDTYLSDLPIPPLAEIASDPEFKPFVITKEEFEGVWATRKAKARL